MPDGRGRADRSLLVGPTDPADEHINGAVGFTTPTTISLSLGLSRPFTGLANVPIRGGLGGGAVVLLARRSGATLSTTTQSLPESLGLPPWRVDLTTTIASTSVGLDMRATASIPPDPQRAFFGSGATCDTGPQIMTLSPVPSLP